MSKTFNVTTASLGSEKLIDVVGLKGLGKFCSSTNLSGVTDCIL